ncbi:IclR family transcriptional regulator [Natrialbaceae archaeon A-gly3]
MPRSHTGKERGIKATETSFAIIETLHRHQPARLTELAEETGVANSTAHDHLMTLREYGYVVKRDEGYYLALKFLGHDMQTKNHYKELLSVSEPALEQLVNETDEAVNLVVEEHERAVYIDRLTGKRGVSTNSWVGKRKPLHTLSAGKAILAHLPEQRVEVTLITHKMTAATDQTITSRDRLYEELETIRNQGVSFNDRESHGQTRAVGAPNISSVLIIYPTQKLLHYYF